MKAAIQIAAALALGLMLPGCDSIPTRPPASSFFVARLQDCKGETYIPPRENFAPGEVAALVCINYAGRTVTLRVNNISTGAISWNRTEYLPVGRTKCWWSLNTLPGGTYRAEILDGGTLLQSYNFEIARPTPSPR